MESDRSTHKKYRDFCLQKHLETSKGLDKAKVTYNLEKHTASTDSKTHVDTYRHTCTLSDSHTQTRPLDILTHGDKDSQVHAHVDTHTPQPHQSKSSPSLFSCLIAVKALPPPPCFSGPGGQRRTGGGSSTSGRSGGLQRTGREGSGAAAGSTGGSNYPVLGLPRWLGFPSLQGQSH
jgi:hypothetical protein